MKKGLKERNYSAKRVMLKTAASMANLAATRTSTKNTTRAGFTPDTIQKVNPH